MLDYLDRAKRSAESQTGSRTTRALTKTIEAGGDWNQFRNETRTDDQEERRTRIVAEARDAGLSPFRSDRLAEGLIAAPAPALDDESRGEIEALTKKLVGDSNAQRLADVLEGAAAAVAAQNTTDQIRDEAQAEGLRHDKASELAANIASSDVPVIDLLIKSLRGLQPIARPHIPWRLYLTPRLDTYVDFHRSSLLAYRREAKSDRQDACTVWLRVFEQGAQVPIPYRLVTETTLVPSFATWINGQLVDDYGGESASGGAWGDQAISGSNRTGPHCSNRTGPRCMW